MFRNGFARCPLDGTPLQELIGDPLSGSLFADRYVVEELVGEGAAGRVYRARHQRVSRRFAIKVLFGDFATDAKMRQRFEHEAEAASRLSHPNVISVVDFGETQDGLLYLVMDYCEGRELAEVIWDEGPFDPGRAERILRGLLEGLHHAHSRELVHRDFKGENVILEGEGALETPRIVDFGIAVLSEGTTDSRLTTEGIVLGTPAFMSPEQASGVEIDARTDLFSLGVLLYQMLTGVLPFEGTPVAIARQNVTHDPPPMSSRVPELQVPPRLEAIAMRLMAKEPEDRFQSAQEVLEALDDDSIPIAPETSTIRGLPGATLPPAGWTGQPGRKSHWNTRSGSTERIRGRRFGRRGWWMAAVVGIVALGVVAALRSLGGDDHRGGRELAVAGQGEQGDGTTLPAGDPVEPDGDSEASGSAGPPAADIDSTTPEEDAAPDGEDAQSEAAQESSEVQRRPMEAEGGQDTRTTKRAAPKPRRTAKASAKNNSGSKGSDDTEKDDPVPATYDPEPEPAKPPPAVSVTSLTQRYERVGEAVEALAAQRGGALAAPLRREFRRIPFADALRKQSLRREVDATLRDLERRIRAAR